MRMSCNGCRVLRKGCSENCSIRPCLQWIKSAESQGHATVFLAKFYGRAGLMNLINAGPDHLRPAIFRSLLYEACGRIVNPIYGSVGLLWSNSWQLCQAAVESVLKGAPISEIPSETAVNSPVPPLKPYDIRHVSKNQADVQAGRTTRVKRYSSNNNNNNNKRVTDLEMEMDIERVFKRAKSHESCGSGSHMTESMVSVQTVDASHVSQVEAADESEIELELTLGLGFEPVGRVFNTVRAEPEPEPEPGTASSYHVELGLELYA